MGQEEPPWKQVVIAVLAVLISVACGLWAIDVAPAGEPVAIFIGAGTLALAVSTFLIGALLSGGPKQEAMRWIASARR